MAASASAIWDPAPRVHGLAVEDYFSSFEYIGGGEIRDTSFARCSFEKMTLANLDWDGGSVDLTTFRKSTLSTCRFANVRFTSSLLLKTTFDQGCSLSNVVFDRCALQHVRFVGVRLSNVHFVDCEFDLPVFRDCEVEGLRFDRSRVGRLPPSEYLDSSVLRPLREAASGEPSNGRPLRIVVDDEIGLPRIVEGD